MCNKHSHPIKFRRFTSAFPHLKPFTRLGRLDLRKTNTHHLFQRYKLLVRRWTNITRRQHLQTRTSLPWVNCVLSFYFGSRCWHLHWHVIISTQPTGENGALPEALVYGVARGGEGVCTEISMWLISSTCPFFWFHGIQFEARYHQINALAASTSAKTRKRGGLKSLLHQLGDDESDSNLAVGPSSSINPEQPWKQTYNAYIDTVHDVPEGMSIVQWWGVCQFRNYCFLELTLQLVQCQ